LDILTDGFISLQQGKLLLSFWDTFTVCEFHLAPDLGFNAHVIVTPLNFLKSCSKTPSFRGTWVAQSIEHLTLGFGTGHDLRIMDPALHLAPRLAGSLFEDSLSLPLPLLAHIHAHILSLSLSP